MREWAAPERRWRSSKHSHAGCQRRANSRARSARPRRQRPQPRPRHGCARRSKRYPNDYRVLGMAARYEQARGDNERAADYWRAAIKAMPANSPTDRLAHDLAYPDQDNSPHKAVTAGDLQQLLNPDYVSSTQRFPKTVMLPPLPAYGPDPYMGRAPVAIVPAASAPPMEPSVPATTEIPVPQADPAAVNNTLGSSPETQNSPSASPAASAASPAPGKTPPAHHARRSTHAQQSSGPTSYTGQVHLPPSEEFITSTDADKPPVQAAPAPPAQPVYIPPPPAENQSPRQTAPPTQPPAQTPPVQQAPKVFIPVLEGLFASGAAAGSSGLSHFHRAHTRSGCRGAGSVCPAGYGCAVDPGRCANPATRKRAGPRTRSERGAGGCLRRAHPQRCPSSRNRIAPEFTVPSSASQRCPLHPATKLHSALSHRPHQDAKNSSATILWLPSRFFRSLYR